MGKLSRLKIFRNKFQHDLNVNADNSSEVIFMNSALWSAFMKTGNPICYLMEAESRKINDSASERGRNKPPD